MPGFFYRAFRPVLAGDDDYVYRHGPATIMGRDLRQVIPPPGLPPCLRSCSCGWCSPSCRGFATASSESVYPWLVERLERFGVPDRISGFVLLLRYSFNLDGSVPLPRDRKANWPATRGRKGRKFMKFKEVFGEAFFKKLRRTPPF
ncbi:hypothetical protein BGC31_10020 [Komagataeibacter xylinus]|nr:C4-dicarboxylate transporter [Komagataeibacter xylinus E25]RFP02800.1 hypothetical protein BFX83_12555 [Komagataeibacter xylinus]RFP02853.1 hypothetical protein BGC31_10020 [Komagataeibacter xylinus]